MKIVIDSDTSEADTNEADTSEENILINTSPQTEKKVLEKIDENSEYNDL